MGQHVYVGIITCMMSEIYKEIQSVVGAPVTCMWRFKMYKDSLVCIKKSLTLLMCHQQFTQTEGCNHNIVGLVFLRRLLTAIYNFQRAYLKQDSKVVKSLFFLIYNQDVIIVIIKDIDLVMVVKTAIFIHQENEDYIFLLLDRSGNVIS